MSDMRHFRRDDARSKSQHDLMMRVEFLLKTESGYVRVMGCLLSLFLSFFLSVFCLHVCTMPQSRQDSDAAERDQT